MPGRHRCALSLVSALLLSGCGEHEPDNFDITATVSDGEVTFSWDGRAVHEFTMLGPNGWQVAMVCDASGFTDSRAMVNLEPTITPPIVYGATVDGAETCSGGDGGLEEGQSYDVNAVTYVPCEEVGLDGEVCFTAFGRGRFTF